MHPQWFFAVPRIWEKLKAGLETMVHGQPAEQREPLRARAGRRGREGPPASRRASRCPADLAERVAAADAAHFAQWRAMLGLDEVVAINVGAAPTPVEVLEFFHAIGLPVSELWGMSETCGLGHRQPARQHPDRHRRPAGRRASRSGSPTTARCSSAASAVMRGYRNKPDQTAETIDADGWLHTGDIGACDDAGHLRIIDRKKEIIINAAGKNMSPANIEAHVKSAHPLIGQACCIGDARPVQHGADRARRRLRARCGPRQQGIEDTSLEALAARPGA